MYIVTKQLLIFNNNFVSTLNGAICNAIVALDELTKLFLFARIEDCWRNFEPRNVH